MNPSRTLPALLREIRACRACAEHLPHGPRPIVAAGSAARIALIGQAPGRRVHESGVAWADASGTRLRAWLGVSDEQFYDRDRFCIVPTGFCYPGSSARGDLPPRPECAPLWHAPLWDALPSIRLRVLIGAHAHRLYLGGSRKPTLAGSIRAPAERDSGFFVLPHPSPRNRAWFASNPWFEDEILPRLRARIAALLD
jgi:uracil-DNA glycosylase